MGFWVSEENGAAVAELQAEIALLQEQNKRLVQRVEQGQNI